MAEAFAEKEAKLAKGKRVEFVAGGKKYLAVVPLMGQVPFATVPKAPKKGEAGYNAKLKAWQEGCKDVVATGKVVIYEVTGKGTYKEVKKPKELVTVKAGEKVKGESDFMVQKKLKKVPKLKG